MKEFAKAFDDAKAHARKVFPEESCGLIVANAYIECTNVAGDITLHIEKDPDCRCRLCAFEIKLSDLKKHMPDDIQMVIHSHPNGPAHPSRADMENQILTDKTWAIVPLDDERVGEMVIWGDDVAIAPVVGRAFVHAVADCYTLIRDCYRLGSAALAEQGIENWPLAPVTLNEFAREDGWWTGEGDFYETEPDSYGFVEIDASDAKPGDVFLMKIRSEKFNHGGLLLDNGLVLHHLPNRPSRREPAVLWARHIGRWLRYAKKESDNA